MAARLQFQARQFCTDAKHNNILFAFLQWLKWQCFFILWDFMHDYLSMLKMHSPACWLKMKCDKETEKWGTNKRSLALIKQETRITTTTLLHLVKTNVCHMFALFLLGFFIALLTLPAATLSSCWRRGAIMLFHTNDSASSLVLVVSSPFPSSEMCRENCI